MTKPMDRRRLGRTDVEVTAMGFSGGPLGGLFEPLDDATAARALEAAYAGGVRYFDTLRGEGLIDDRAPLPTD